MGRKAPTSDRLRHAIDRGHAGDKRGFPDPAAAPLGTDDEAGGNPPTAQQRRQAWHQEIVQRPDARDATGSGRPVSGEPGTTRARRGLWIVIIAVGVVLCGVAALLF